MRTLRALLFLVSLLLMATAGHPDTALLGGIGNSHYLGESGPYPQFHYVGRYSYVGIELDILGAEKIETGDGWIGSGAIDYWSGPLSVGARYSHRETGQWSKSAWWARFGAAHGPLRLLAEVSPSSQNIETKLEARLRFAYPIQDWSVLLETRVFVEIYSDTNQDNRNGAYGAALLVGIGR